MCSSLLVKVIAFASAHFNTYPSPFLFRVFSSLPFKTCLLEPIAAPAFMLALRFRFYLSFPKPFLHEAPLIFLNTGIEYDSDKFMALLNGSATATREFIGILFEHYCAMAEGSPGTRKLAPATPQPFLPDPLQSPSTASHDSSTQMRT